MFSFRQPGSSQWRWVIAFTLIVFIGLVHNVQAAITASNPADRYGVNPVVFTVDPFLPEFGGPYADNIERGVANTRKLRQTFQNPTTFNVGQINLSFRVTGGSSVGSTNDTGLRLAFYEVADVLASNWTPGNLIKEVVLQPGNMPAASQVLRFDLSGGDVFSLPQSNSGTAGYGLEISTPNALSSDGNPGTIKFTNNSASDYYATGRYYTETGTASTAYRDVGLSLVASTQVACDPGDVNCMGGVTIDDLNIIAAHFRQNGSREQGDLTGNGYVDFDDFDQWKRNYTGPGLGAESFAFLSVPEPGGLTLLIVGSVGLLSRKRHRP